MTDTLLPFVNAHLQQVQAAGGGERYDRPRTAGAVKWQSTPGVDTPAYVYEVEATTSAGGELDQPSAATQAGGTGQSPAMTVDASLGIGWARGDTVTYDHLQLDPSGNVVSSVSESRRIKDVNTFEVVGLTEILFWEVP